MKKITSNIAKLIRHPRVCSGTFLPVTAQIALTERCNLNCSFCTAGGKNRKSSASLETPALLSLLSDLKELGCKGIEYTGGGEPTIHKDFVAIIDETLEMGFDVGLITNGTQIKRLSSKIGWENFDWVRISVNSGKERYAEVHGVDKFDVVMEGLSILSKRIPGRFGVSYIYSEQPLEDIDTLLYSVAEVAPYTGYIRVGLDVLKYRNGLPAAINIFNEKVLKFSKETGIFADVQTGRDLAIPRKCYMGRLKPSISAEGIVFPCCIAQHKNFGAMCTISEYKARLQEDSLIDVDINECPYCIYKKLNNFVQAIEESDVKNVNFI